MFYLSDIICSKGGVCLMTPEKEVPARTVNRNKQFNVINPTVS